MKKYTITLALMMSLSMSIFAQTTMSAYISDPSGSTTNIRTAPKGKVAFSLSNKSSYIVLIKSPRNGWWQVKEIEIAENGESVKMKGSSTGYWIHYSVLALGTSNYGGQKLSLREKPSSKAKRVYTFSTEKELRPLDVKGEWVKVVTSDGKHTGWIERENLCSNPLTNCC